MFSKIESNKELWDLFTSREEYKPALLDKFQRFPYYMSVQKSAFDPSISVYLTKNGYDPCIPEAENLPFV